MSNLAYLIGANDPSPAGQDGEGSVNYDYESQVLADSGKWIIPLFWFSVFDESHLVTFGSEEFEMPTVVCSKASGLAVLQRRGQIILSWFAGADAFWPAWERLLSEAPFQYFKMDLTEIWELDPDLFAHDFPMALRGLSSATPEDFEKLLQLTGIDRDLERGTFSAAGSPLNGSFLHGFRANREVPWTDD